LSGTATCATVRRLPLDRVCGFLQVQVGAIDEVPRQNVSWYVPDTRVNAVLRLLLRTGGRFGHSFPVAARAVLRDPLLAALHRRRAGPRLRPSVRERAVLIPEFAEEIRLLERLTGESYADWLVADHRGSGPDSGPASQIGGEPAVAVGQPATNVSSVPIPRTESS
jgi:hypothetical protein